MRCNALLINIVPLFVGTILAAPIAAPVENSVSSNLARDPKPWEDSGVSIGTGIVVRKPEAEAEAKPWEDSGVSIGTGIVVRKPKAEAEAEAKPWEDSGVSIGTGIVVRKPKAEAEAEAKPWEDSATFQGAGIVARDPSPQPWGDGTRVDLGQGGFYYRRNAQPDAEPNPLPPNSLIEPQ